VERVLRIATYRVVYGGLPIGETALQLYWLCRICGKTLYITFDMRDAQKAQPFVHPSMEGLGL